MLYPSMGELSNHISNRYMLVNVVARRARQISEECVHEEESPPKKTVTMAINEVADGTLDFAESVFEENNK